MDYEKDISINIDSLDIEWMRHSQLYIKYAELSAKAEQEKNEVKERLELIKAELDTSVREKAKKGGEKTTELMVQSCIIQSEEYKTQLEKLNGKIYNYNILKSVVIAFEHRKKALENLVHLWSGSYFSSPKETKGDPEVKEKILDKARSKQRQGLKK